MEKSASYKRGEDLLRKMAGDEYMKSREERVRLFPDMDELIMGTLYGEVWERPNLDKRSRSMIMVALAVGIMEVRQNMDSGRAADLGWWRPQIIIQPIPEAGVMGAWRCMQQA